MILESVTGNCLRVDSPAGGHFIGRSCIPLGIVEIGFRTVAFRWIKAPSVFRLFSSRSSNAV